MKKNLNMNCLVSLFFITMLVAGCASPKSQTQYTSTVPATIVMTSVTPTPRPTQIDESLQEATISEQAYISPSGVFQINLPEGWNCSESGDYQVNCESQSSDARLQARLSSTGYELTNDSFNAFIHAELVHRYGRVKEYSEAERNELADQIFSRATWREETDYWDSLDSFTQQGRGIFHMSFAYKQSQTDVYANLFKEISDSVKIYQEKITDDAFYPFRKTVTAREALFEIEVPTSWGRYIDTASVAKTIVEGYTSPDKRASVQIAVYKQGTFIEQEAKAFNTREVMFELYGYDLKNSDDRALPDGRERLTWYAAGKDIRGITDFDTYVNTLYLFTITWEPSTERLYLPILEEIQMSFSRE